MARGWGFVSPAATGVHLPGPFPVLQNKQVADTKGALRHAAAWLFSLYPD